MLTVIEGGVCTRTAMTIPANEHQRATIRNTPFAPSPYRIASGWMSGLVNTNTPAAHIAAIIKSTDNPIDSFSNRTYGMNILAAIAGKTNVATKQHIANLRINVGDI
jgi:hypothetical protein